MVPLGPLCSQKFINKSPKPAILLIFAPLFWTSLGRWKAVLGAISWLVLDMGCLEVVRGSNGPAGAPVQPKIYK